MPEYNILLFPETLSRPTFNRDRFKEARLEARLTQTELAKRVNVSVETVSNIESAHRMPGAETLTQFCKVLGYPPSYFATSDTQEPTLQGSIFFRSYASKTKRQNHCLNVWRLWAGRVLNHLGYFLKLPEVKLPEASWTADDSLDDLVERAEALAQECRRAWGIGDGPIANLTRLVESMGVCVIRLRLDAMNDVDGFSCWQDGRPFIFLVAKDSAARERLNLAHEILHLVAHRQVPTDTLEDDAAMKRIETQAKTFATALLLPRQTYGREVFSFTIPHFTEQKRRWGVSIGAQGKRCLDMGAMDDDQHTQFRKNLSWNHYIKKEPLDDTMPHEEPLMMRQAIELLNQHNVVKGWQLAEKFGLSADKMQQLTTVNASVFESPVAELPAMSIKFPVSSPSSDAETR